MLVLVKSSSVASSIRFTTVSAIILQVVVCMSVLIPFFMLPEWKRVIRFRFVFSSRWSFKICSHAMTSVFVVLYVMLHAHFGLPVGFRFGMYRGEHVDILYGNVKHAFFQVSY